jgi:NAD(P)H-dependent FMN reductase
VNGSLRGRDGNSGALLAATRRALGADVECDDVVLAEYAGSVQSLAERLRAAHGFIFGTGVYWSSWGSPLQRFLEVMTSYELSDCFLGKPAAVVVTMDSVGGSDVAQRLLGVLSTFGCLIPPLSSVIISRISELVALRSDSVDVWQVADVQVLAQNVLKALELAPAWSTWPIDKAPAFAGAYPASGLLNAGLPRFLNDASESEGK